MSDPVASYRGGSDSEGPKTRCSDCNYFGVY